MRDVQNHAPFFAKLADNAEQMLDFTRRERAGRLIERDDFGVARQRFGDFNHLPLADGEIFQRRLRVDIEPQMLKLQLRLIVEERAVDYPGLVRDLAQIDVFRHAHLRYQMQLLVDDGDARVERRRGVAKGDLFAFDGDRAGGRRVVAAENFQQRRFPGAVFSHQRMHLPCVAVKADIGKRLHAGKGFPDAAKREIG